MLASSEDYVVTGIGMVIPKEQLPHLDHFYSDDLQEFNPKETLGKKGLAYKDRSTLMALCAVKFALLDAGIDIESNQYTRDMGVVVSSNLGNFDTIVQSQHVICNEHAAALSVMDIPKASCNIIASTIAIRYKVKGSNLTLCNGASSGGDAVGMATKLIQTQRVKRVIVVGVEPNNIYVDKFLKQQPPDEWENPHEYHIGEGAACLIIESRSAFEERKSTVKGITISHCIKDIERLAPLIAQALKANLQVDWFIPNPMFKGIRKTINQSVQINNFNGQIKEHDISSYLGDLYGALGVFQCAIGVSLLRKALNDRDRMVIASSGGSWGDPITSVILGGGAK